MRNFLYWLARMMGDGNSLVKGTTIQRHVRKKGLTRSGSFWGKVK